MSYLSSIIFLIPCVSYDLFSLDIFLIYFLVFMFLTCKFSISCLFAKIFFSKKISKFIQGKYYWLYTQNKIYNKTGFANGHVRPQRISSINVVKQVALTKIICFFTFILIVWKIACARNNKLFILSCLLHAILDWDTCQPIIYMENFFINMKKITELNFSYYNTSIVYLSLKTLVFKQTWGVSSF